jgi:membrane protease YdiL (CAAX protease family)
MELKYFKKNLTDYLFLLFLGFSFWQCLKGNQLNILLYYVILFLVFILLKATENGVTGIFTLKFKHKNGKWSYFSTALIMLASITLSVTLIFIVQSRFLNTHYAIKNNFDYNFAFTFFVFNTVRILGEETIFRGFLLVDNIRNNNKLFWILNFAQAALFCLIHSTFVHELTGKLVFTTYAFFIAFLMGWLNRKYNSILPSWLIHWCNGILNFFFIF